MSLFAAIAFLLCAIAAHAAAARFLPSGKSVLLFVAVGTPLGLLLTLSLLGRYGLGPQVLSGLLLFAFGCELYLFLFTIAMSSISANLLVTLAERNLMAAEIDRLYDSERMVAQRLDRLSGNGLLAEAVSGSLVLTARGRGVVRLFEVLRRFFHHAVPAGPAPRAPGGYAADGHTTRHDASS